MTYHATKVRNLLRKGAPLEDVLMFQPYKPKNYHANLPKGWMRMCKQAGLRPSGRHKRGANHWRYLKGAGRHWFLSKANTFRVSMRYADFDRWANSTIAEWPVPQNITELLLRTKFVAYDTLFTSAI